VASPLGAGAVDAAAIEELGIGILTSRDVFDESVVTARGSPVRGA
jgi:hypothetical protein